jgi:hypothetical protein
MWHKGHVVDPLIFETKCLRAALLRVRGSGGASGTFGKTLAFAPGGPARTLRHAPECTVAIGFSFHVAAARGLAAREDAPTEDAPTEDAPTEDASLTNNIQ